MNRITFFITIVLTISCAKEPEWKKVSSECVEPSLFLHKKLCVACAESEKLYGDTLDFPQIGMIVSGDDSLRSCKIVVPWPAVYPDKTDYFTLSIFDVRNRNARMEMGCLPSSLRNPVFNDASCAVECKCVGVWNGRAVGDVVSVYAK